MKAADLYVDSLEEEGVEYIFGVPGEENADFMISLEKSESIRFVLTRHEQGAAFMAEIYGRLTGQGSTSRLHKESHQIMDVVGMFEPVTKWATAVLGVGGISHAIRDMSVEKMLVFNSPSII